MRTELFDYDLPPELIAQEPLSSRSAARMLVVDGHGGLTHRTVAALPELLAPGDCLVVNDSRVIPARLLGRKASGGEAEVLLVHHEADQHDEPGERWRCLIRARVRIGTAILFAEGGCVVTAIHDDGARTVAFPPGLDVLGVCERIGHVPLPPYIAREDDARDRSRYQTVYAAQPGSVAAPTAGLHLDEALLARIRARGVALARVELAIGPGTFKPVDTPTIEEFRIHAEHCRCPPAAVEAIVACRARGGRVVAVGTTVMRTVESAARQPGGFAPYDGWTTLFLHPPQRFRLVDALLTNFHMPRSTLLMAVSCLLGVDGLRATYAAAIAARYRFLSYGDCMFIATRGATNPSGS